VALAPQCLRGVTSVKESRLLWIFPYWKENPYPNLMALASASDGFEVSGRTRFESLLGDLATCDGTEVLHFQWTSPVVQRATSVEDAEERLAALRTALENFKSKGGRLVWTVHNALAHETEFVDQEILLMQLLVELADAIHIMNPSTVEALPSQVIVPQDKVVAIPHPSYVGVYPRRIDRAEARERLGVPEGKRVVAFIGQIRAYKGVTTLLQALDSIEDPEADQYHLLLAGRVRGDELKAIESALPKRISTTYVPEFIDDNDLNLWYSAADVAVLPYTRILNSGSLHLAASYGCPVVMPGEKHLVDEFGDEPWVHFYDPQDPVKQIRQLILGERVYEDHPKEFADFNRRRSFWALSRRFRDEVVRGHTTNESGADSGRIEVTRSEAAS
jgi:glycosyltransferase involved in cell wall biosynthesis